MEGDLLAQKRVHMELVDRAFKIGNHSGKILLSRLNEDLIRIEPFFSHKKLGFHKFLYFCRTLEPEYVVCRGETDNKNWFIERNSNLVLDSHGIETSAASRRTYLELVGRALQKTDYPTRIIKVQDLIDTLRALDPHIDLPELDIFCKSLQPYYLALRHGNSGPFYYVIENSDWWRAKSSGQLVEQEAGQTIESSTLPSTLDTAEKDLSV